MKRSTPGISVFWAPSKKRFILSYATSSGRKPKTMPRDVTTQRAADAWAVDFLAAKGTKPAEALAARRDEGPTLAEVAPKWLALRKSDPKVSPSTYGNNASQLKNHVLPAFGSTPLAALDVPAIREWIRTLRADRSPQTVRNIYYTASTLYADAMAEGWVKREANPFAHPGVAKELPELDEADPVNVPAETAQALLDAVVIPLERRARYALAFTSGCRDGEIAGLRLGDLELDGDIPLFRVAQAVALVGLTGWATPNKTKTRGSRRTLPFHPAALAAVREWFAAGWPMLVGRVPAPGDYLFPAPDGGPARPRSAELLRADLEAAGLPIAIRGVPVEFKATRSSFATWLSNAGVPDPIRKRLMGHRAKDVTERHYTVRDLSALADAVAKIPLAWSAGIVPFVVPVGIVTEANPPESLAPPARIGLATFGLGSGDGARRHCAGESETAGVDRAETAPRIGLAGPIGSRFCADVVPPDLTSARLGIAALVALDPTVGLELFEAELAPELAD